MLKGSSANRLTKIKVHEGGKVIKTITNASLNYGQDYEQLRKMVEIAIRLSPQDPIYNVERIFIVNPNDNKEIEFDQSELEQFQVSLFKPENQVVGHKISLSVHVKDKKAKGPARSGSFSMPVDENVGESNDNVSVASGSNKYDSFMRSASPFAKRSTTPNKMRSVSRGRCVTSQPSATKEQQPAHFPRGVSPARRPMSTNARPISQLLGEMNLACVSNEIANAAAAPVASVVVNSTPVAVEEPAVEEAPASEPTPMVDPAEAIAAFVTAEVSTSKSTVPEVKTPIKQPISVARPAAVPHDEQSAKKIIEQTWTEIGDEANSPVPSTIRTLAPFSYYSPVPEATKPSDEPIAAENATVQSDANVTDVAAVETISAPSVDAEVSALVAAIESSVTIDEQDNCSVISSQISASIDELEAMSSAATVPQSPPRASLISAEVPRSPGSDDVTTTSSSSNRPTNNVSMKTPQRSAKKSMLSSAVKTPSGKIVAASSLVPMTVSSSKPVFPDGRTLRESSLNYEQSLRSYGGAPTTPSGKKKPVSKSSHTNGGGGGGSEFSPLFAKSKSSSHQHADGRPSIGTMTTQWEFMRTNFVNNSDEELEWLMISKKQGAYNYAHRKNEQSEDRYFKSLYDTDFFEAKIKHFAGYGAKIPAIIGELAALYNTLMATPKDEAAITQVQTQHAKLVEQMRINEAQNIFAAFDPKIEQTVLAILQETDRFKIVRKARDLHGNLTTEITALQGKLVKARKDGDEALKNMEKWSKRSMEAEEYPTVMRAQEQAWLEKELDDNTAAYRAMRAYFPPNIMDIQANDIVNLYVEHGGLTSMELAQELKANKCLQWLETHPDDIVYDSFLTGERKAYFENLESMDIIEMRALATVIPVKFELDNDGKKAEWRGRFFARLKQMVSQQRREKVKGPWDPTKNMRTLVDLPPLKPDHLRRPIYYFRTKEQSDLKLKQFDDKLALLAKKKKWLEAAETETKDAKEEYDTVLKEMRDPDFIDMYGADQLASVKDMAKNEWVNAEKKRKTLAADVARLQKSIDDSPFTRDQLLDKENELERFLLGKGILWAEKGQAPVVIEGVFDPEKPLEKRIKASAKFLSAEEEAAKRKEELEVLKARSMAVGAEDELALADPLAAMNSGDAAEGSGRSSDSIAPSTAVIEVGGSSSSAAAAYAAATASATANMPMTPCRTPGRKHSILTHTNPELLNTLNKMFSPGATAPPGARARTPSRRVSVAVTGASSAGGALFLNGPNSVKKPRNSDGNSNGENEDQENGGDRSNAPKEMKKSKSKLLKKMLGQEEEPPKINLAATLPARPNPFAAAMGGGGGAGGMSFLDQIKARRNKNNDAADDSNVSSSSSGSNSDNSSSNSQPVDFLSKTISFPLPPQPPSEASEGDSAPKMPFRRPNPFAAMGGGGGGGGMSFLDQIKARRMAEE